MYILSEWVREWLYTYKRIMLKPSTFDSYVSYSSHIDCDVRLSELRLIDVQRMVNDMVLEGLKLSTIKHMVVVVRQSLKKARALGIIDNLSCLEGLEFPKSSPKLVEGLDDESLFLLLKNAHKSIYGDFFRTLLFTGMRVGELIALRWCDVDFIANKIYVVHTDYKGELQAVKTRHGVRAIPLMNDVELIFRKLYSDRKPRRDERVFLNSLGLQVRYTSVRDCWRRFSEQFLPVRYGECYGLHTLRHTFAHSALRAGVPVKVVSAWLGHADISITLQIYDHVDNNDWKNAAILISNAFEDKKKTISSKDIV